MDWGSVAGLLLALGGIVAGQMIEGGHIGSLLQPAALLIVVVGTLGAVLMQSGLRNFTRAIAMARYAFVPPDDDHGRLSRAFVFWSNMVRREGLLSLERHCERESDPFIRKGLRLIVDGIDAARLRLVLEQDINIYERRERAVAQGLGIGRRLCADGRHPRRGAGADPGDGKPRRPDPARRRHRGGLCRHRLRRRPGQPGIPARSAASSRPWCRTKWGGARC